MARFSSAKAKSLRNLSADVAVSESTAPRSLGLKKSNYHKVELGSKLKRVRLDRGMTLEEVSRKSGVARSTLSKIENGLMSPTYAMLQKVIGGLSLSFVELFESDKMQEHGVGRRSITRAGRGQKFDIGHDFHEMIAAEIVKKKMLPAKCRIVARDISECDGMIRHAGEEFIYVLTGQVKVVTDIYTAAILNPGDSIYFDSTMAHACLSASEEPAEVLWIGTSREPIPDSKVDRRRS